MAGWSLHSQKWDEDYGVYLQIYVQQRISTKTRSAAPSNLLFGILTYPERVSDEHEPRNDLTYIYSNNDPGKARRSDVKPLPAKVDSQGRWQMRSTL